MLDDQFRRLVLEGTSRLELTLRARLAYNLALNGNAYIYDEPDSYRDIAYPDGTLKRDALISSIKGWASLSHEVCIRHYRHQHAATGVGRGGGTTVRRLIQDAPVAFGHGCRGQDSALAGIVQEPSPCLGNRACDGFPAQPMLASLAPVEPRDGDRPIGAQGHEDSVPGV